MSKTIDISLIGNETTLAVVGEERSHRTFSISLSKAGLGTDSVSGERGIVVDFYSLPKSVFWEDIYNKPTFHKVATSGNYNDLKNKPDLKPVATSGEYGDLTGKPSVNNVTLNGNKSAADLGLATAAQGAKADTAYQKPVGGIPGSDMSADVQSALEKAETALQEHQSLEGYATEAWVEDQGYLTQHQDISGKADKSDTYTKQEVDDSLSGKQDTLVSGENIKTINGESILGSGNIVIQGGGGGTGDYEDLDNLPSINNVELIGNKTAAQLGLQTELTIDATPTEGSTNPVQSGGVYEVLEYKLDKEELYSRLGFPDFDASLYYSPGDIVVYNGDLYVFTAEHHGQWDAGDVEHNDIYKELKDLYVDLAEQIDGKQDVISDLSTIRSGAAAGATAVQPSDLATVATSGSYNDLLNKPNIPAAQVQSDWNEADNTKVDYIKNKPTIPDVSGKADKVGGATNGDFAGLDANGNLTDSGKKASDFATPIPVVDASTIPASMEPNKLYKYGTLSGDTVFPSLATPTDQSRANVYWWKFTTPASTINVQMPSSITIWNGGQAPTIDPSTTYEITVEDGFGTCIKS